MNTQVSIQSESAPLPADPMVSMIERIALDPNADLDKLERMLAMKERMDAQNAKVAFAHSLSVARAEMPPIVKDATVAGPTISMRLWPGSPRPLIRSCLKTVCLIGSALIRQMAAWLSPALCLTGTGIPRKPRSQDHRTNPATRTTFRQLGVR